MKLKAMNALRPFRKLQFIGDHAPLVRGRGPETYHCVECDEILLVGMSPAEIVEAVFRCPRCGAYNELDTIEQHSSAA